MKNYIISIFIFFAVMSTVRAQERVALVIGNSAYVSTSSFSELPAAKADAQDICNLLHDSLQFEISDCLIDADNIQITDALNNFKEKSKIAKIALIYYSGHGVVDTYGDEYIVPITAKYADDYLSMRKLEDIVKYGLIEAGGSDNMKIFLYDACRSNKDFVKPSGVKHVWDYTSKSNSGYPAGIQIVFSSSLNGYSIGGDARNSLFTEGLLKYMTSEAEFTDFVGIVGDFVRAKSQKYHKKQQTIDVLGTYVGEFYFNTKKCTSVY